MKHDLAGFLVVGLLFAAGALADDATTTEPETYTQLREWMFTASSVPVPAGGFEIVRENAKWRFDSGSFRAMRPLANGLSTGLVFEGSGRFTMEVPNQFELEQLRRFAGREKLERLQTPFSTLVLRTSMPLVSSVIPEITSDSWSTPSIVEERQKKWLEFFFHDADARIARALRNRLDDYLIVELDSQDFGWLTIQWDTFAIEELTLRRLNGGFPEEWVSLDRESQRLPDGRSSRARVPLVNLRHIELEADLTKSGDGNKLGFTQMRPTDGIFGAALRIAAIQDGVGAIELSLDPGSKVTSVTGENGVPLKWIRFPVGRHFLSVKRKYHDDTLSVFFEEPMKAGEERTIHVAYELEVPNYGLGDGWYPTPPDSINTVYTARMELVTKDGVDIRAMGKLESQTREQGNLRSVYVVERPAKMLTFTIGHKYSEEKVEAAGVADVVAFAPPMGLGSGSKIYNVAADVSNSIKFFENLFGSKLDPDTVLVTGIPSGHGQSFDGFIHMSEGTFTGEHPGASELFRAHEVAHQWFGHKVGWKTYRDQWLSESLAEYAAMMFIESEVTVKNGSKLFDEILMVYHNTILGSLRGGMSKFARPWLATMSMNETHVGRLGPIGVGLRAGTREIPAGYLIQNYMKGPAVIHMLRVLLRIQSGDDKLFVTILRDFINTYDGASASTDDFKEIVSKHTMANWDWFFDQWIERAEIPTFYWSYDTSRQKNENGMYPITIRVRRENVPEAFVQPVPVRVEIDRGRYATITVVVKEPEQEFTFELPSRAGKVEFNPGHSILARVRKM